MATNDDSNNDDDKEFSATEAAEYLGVKPGTLAVWRSTGRHSLPFIKIGRIRYRKKDLDDLKTRQTFLHTR